MSDSGEHEHWCDRKCDCAACPGFEDRLIARNNQLEERHDYLQDQLALALHRCELSGWTPVTDRLPDNKKLVLICYLATDQGTTFPTVWLGTYEPGAEGDYFDHGPGWFHMDAKFDDWVRRRYLNVTHWMPLPSVPTALRAPAAPSPEPPAAPTS